MITGKLCENPLIEFARLEDQEAYKNRTYVPKEGHDYGTVAYEWLKGRCQWYDCSSSREQANFCNSEEGANYNVECPILVDYHGLIFNFSEEEFEKFKKINSFNEEYYE